MPRATKKGRRHRKKRYSRGARAMAREVRRASPDLRPRIEMIYVYETPEGKLTRVRDEERADLPPASRLVRAFPNFHTKTLENNVKVFDGFAHVYPRSFNRGMKFGSWLDDWYCELRIDVCPDKGRGSGTLRKDSRHRDYPEDSP